MRRALGAKTGLPGARGDLGEAVSDCIVSARSRAFYREQEKEWVSDVDYW